MRRFLALSSLLFVGLLTQVASAQAAEVLPDLTPLPAAELRLSEENGRTLLRFTAMFLNQGDGPLELFTNEIEPTEDGLLETYQHIAATEGGGRDKVVGDFLWHDIHGHYHFDEFADYTLELVSPATQNADSGTVIVTQKTTFCMRDDVRIDPTAGPRVFVECGKFRQGVSVGWADRYGWELPDQYIDVEGLPAGIYRLSFEVDPLKRFEQVDQNNDTSVVLIELDPAAGTMNLIASGGSIPGDVNMFPDGLLIQGEGDPRVFIMHDNRKRWLRSEEIFRSYGYSWGEIIPLPVGVVNAIISETLVRDPETGAIYQLNNANHRRRLLNPEVVASYEGLASASNINQTELAGYPETDLIRLAGDDSVFSIIDKSYVGEYADLPALDRDPLSVHTVNETDFLAYAVKTIASDLYVPWDVAILPDGDLLVTERSGAVRRLGENPGEFLIPGVKETEEGGLMGIALHPDFESNDFVYLYYTTASDSRNRVVRFRLEEDALVEDRVILSGIPSAIYHDGGQLAFGPDGMLYILTGDANVASSAQDLNSLAGKTLRLTPDGAIPSDNPWGTAVWSYGHRNAQGIAWDAFGRAWETEHGRSGATSGYDELNLVEAGQNYGWPTIQGSATANGMEAPQIQSGADVTWAPSGLAYVDGSLFFAGLRGESLYEAIPNADGSVTQVQAHWTGLLGRLRAVVLGDDGLLYLTTSNRDGRGTPRTGDDHVIVVYPDLLRFGY